MTQRQIRPKDNFKEEKFNLKLLILLYSAIA